MISAWKPQQLTVLTVRTVRRVITLNLQVFIRSSHGGSSAIYFGAPHVSCLGDQHCGLCEARGVFDFLQRFSRLHIGTFERGQTLLFIGRNVDHRCNGLWRRREHMARIDKNSGSIKITQDICCTWQVYICLKHEYIYKFYMLYKLYKLYKLYNIYTIIDIVDG